MSETYVCDKDLCEVNNRVTRHFERVLAAMDCNFRAKNKMNRSTKETSPYLGDGMAFMVPQAPYEEFTASSDHQDEVRSSVRS